MPSICIIGNSHLGALAQSAEGNALFERKNYDLVYWGAAGTLFPKIYYKDGLLISPNAQRSLIISSGRYGDLVIDDFDKLVFYGCHIAFYNQARRFLQLLRRDDRPRSAAFLDLALSDFIAGWWREHEARALIETVQRHHPDKSYVVAAQPMIATSGQYLDEIQDAALFKRVLDAFDDHLDAWCAGIGAIYLRQNQATLDSGLVSTNPCYTKDSVKMEAGEAHPDNDLVHMNGQYGTFVLEDLSEAIDA